MELVRGPALEGKPQRDQGYRAAHPERMLKSAVAYEANANRIDSSTARTCLVMLPIEMQSTPVSATLRTVSSVTLPDASTVIRRPLELFNATAALMSARLNSSSMMMSGP